jgi:hypothetical protein
MSWLNQLVNGRRTRQSVGRRNSVRSGATRWAHLRLETLEGRLAPAAWLAQGPAGAINQPNLVVPPDNRVSGAIEAIAVHPTNANLVYVAAVNGGVWRTTNFTAANPTWTPLTDNLPSLSTSAISLDATNPNAIIVGTGRTSAYGGEGGTLPGLYYSSNSGTSWRVISNPLLAGRNYTSVQARGSVLLAAADNTQGPGGGLFRSTNGGLTWTTISGTNGLPTGPVHRLIGDPGNVQRFYAVVGGNNPGVFRSDNLGLTWTYVSGSISQLGPATTNVQMAIHNSPGNNVIYLGIINGGSFAAIWRSTNLGFNWTQLETPNLNPGGQGDIHASLAADPVNPNLFYVGGDRISTPPFNGNLVRGNAALPIGFQYTPISAPLGANGTAPHADSRFMVFSPNGQLLQADDGGIYRLSDPSETDPFVQTVWTSAVGNLNVFEAHNVAYDTLSQTALIGTQDNSNIQKLFGGNTTWTVVGGPLGSGDGGDVAIDSTTLSQNNQFIRYYSAQNLFNFRREVVDASNLQVVSTTFLNTAPVTDPQFVTPIQLNQVNPTRLIVGGATRIYESFDQGTTLTPIAGSPGVNSSSTGIPLVYGGFLNTIPFPGLIVAGSGTDVVYRTLVGGGFTTTSPGGGIINAVAINPATYTTMFAADNTNVFFTTNAGATWTNITGNLTGLTQGGQLRSLAFIPGSNAIVVGTQRGVYFARVSAPTTWRRLGTSLPNAPAYDLVYNVHRNTLVVSTLGRGVWYLPNVTTVIGGGGGGGGGGGVVPIGPGGLIRPPSVLNNTSNTAFFLGRLQGGSTQVLNGLAVAPTTLGFPGTNWYSMQVAAAGTLTIGLNVTGTQGLQFQVYRRVGTSLVLAGSRQVGPGATGNITLNARLNEQFVIQVRGINFAPGQFTTGGYNLNFTLV